jgi:hypothetical protein
MRPLRENRFPHRGQSARASTIATMSTTHIATAIGSIITNTGNPKTGPKSMGGISHHMTQPEAHQRRRRIFVHAAS